MFKLDPYTTSDEIRTFSASDDEGMLRKSRERREYLEKLATIHTAKQVHVEIEGTEASANIATRDDELGHTDRIVVTIPAVSIDQLASNLDQETWDLLYQKTLLYHEIGHVMYSDWPSYEEKFLEVEHDSASRETIRRSIFASYFNVIEDCAIERILANEFNIEQDLKVKNANLAANREYPMSYGMHEAIELNLHEWKYPTGDVDRLVDPNNSELEFFIPDDRRSFASDARPLIESQVPDIVKEKDPEKRVEGVYNLYLDLVPLIDAADQTGNVNRDNYPDPDDVDDHVSEDGETPEMDLDSVSLGSKEGDPEEGDFTTSKGGEVHIKEADDDDDNTGASIDASVEADIQHDYSEEVDREKDAADQNDEPADVESWGRVIQEEYENGTSMKLTVTEDGDNSLYFDQSVVGEAKRLSNPLKRDLDQRLQLQRHSEIQRGQRSGKLDPKRLHKAEQANINVFKREGEPDEKDYVCILILDRSASMSYGQSVITEATTAAGSLGYALEGVGVDVAQLSMHQGEIQLEKDFSEDVDSVKKRVMHTNCGGGTPMSDALCLSRGRLENRGGHPFVIIVTDGEPDHKERYRDQLEQCNFPVLGVYISDDGNFKQKHINDDSYYHKLEMRHKDTCLDGVRSLVKGVMF